LSKEEIEALEKKHAENPGAREAHKALASEVTRLIHGEMELKFAVRASEILFGGKLDGIDQKTFEEIFAIPTEIFEGVIQEGFEMIGKELSGAPRKFIEKSKLGGAGLPLVELLVHAGLCPSKGQARKDIEGGGVNVNNVRESNFQRAVTVSDLLFGKHLLLRKGKKNYVVVTVK
jgi:tyrosyl-tRNA synthetase